MVVTSVTKSVASRGATAGGGNPTANKPQVTKPATLRRAGSPNEKVENPTHTNKMMSAFSRIGMPNFYKLDKTNYSRGDIADIGQKITKKMDDLEAMLDYERRKN